METNDLGLIVFLMFDVFSNYHVTFNTYVQMNMFFNVRNIDDL